MKSWFTILEELTAELNKTRFGSGKNKFAYDPDNTWAWQLWNELDTNTMPIYSTATPELLEDFLKSTIETCKEGK